MFKQWSLLLALISLTIALGNAQNTDDRVLFTVEDNPVTVDEFTYIYSKTNGEQADFSEASLQEYLDLYVKFKLKVQRARDMELDTIQVLNDELAGYRKQLSDSYLVDRAVVDQLVEEAYAHVQEDVDFSHILFTLRPDANETAAQSALAKAQSAYDRISKGEDFAEVAKEVSEDRYSRDKGGRIGFTTAFFPTGLHALENAAYDLLPNTVSQPIRTQAGYHLLKVHQRRPARGEMEVAHILIRTDERSSEEAKTTIDNIYEQLGSGVAFDQLARTVSEDQRTSTNNGYLGFFGIGRYERAFEDAAFALATDGAYTAPVQTSLGWHIIKRISRKEIQPFADEKPRLEGLVRKDPRFEDAKKALLRQIRDNSNFQETEGLLTEYAESLADTFTNFRWKAPATPSPKVLFSLGEQGDYQVTLGEFENYLEASTRQRMTYSRQGMGKVEMVSKLYDTFVDDQLLKYEESQLENRYPEFRSLMREYEEGILLFEATKIEVWDKAGQDTTGLEQFFETVKGKYRWEPRARVTTYRIGMNNEALVPDVQEYARTHSAEEVLAQFNTDAGVRVIAEENRFERFRNPELAKAEWEAGTVTDAVTNDRSRSITFMKLEELLPAADKTLAEARGYVIADYQDQLEKEWVADLREAYEVDINQKVFRSLVKK